MDDHILIQMRVKEHSVVILGVESGNSIPKFSKLCTKSLLHRIQAGYLWIGSLKRYNPRCE